MDLNVAPNSQGLYSLSCTYDPDSVLPLPAKCNPLVLQSKCGFFLGFQKYFFSSSLSGVKVLFLFLIE